MEVLSARWISDEMEMGDYNFINPSHGSSLDDHHHGFISTHEIASSLFSPNNNHHPSYSSPFNTSTTACSGSTSSIESPRASIHHDHHDKPMKLQKTNSLSSATTEHVLPSPKPSSSTSQILSFGTTSSPRPLDLQHMYENPIESDGKVAQVGSKRTYSTTRTPASAQDHIIAERKRREKLSQRFIALSTVVPGLKKMDKASVLGDAIKYLRQLQERVQLLEEQAKKSKVESVVFVNKIQLSADDETSSSDENSDGGHSSQGALPEIEARVSDKDVLIRIHCEKKKAFVSHILSEIEKLRLSVMHSNVLPFGNSTIYITVMAKMDEDFDMTVMDLVKELRVALLKFI